VRRGEIYLADLGSPVGHEQSLTRPVLVLSAQPWLDSLPPVVTVVPLTRTRRESPTHVEVEPRPNIFEHAHSDMMAGGRPTGQS